MSISDMIDAVAACGRCGKTKPQGCACFVRCGCGWIKDRGAPGCQRCVAVEVQRIGPSRYEARPGTSRVTTRKGDRYWQFTVECGCGCEVSREDSREFRSNKDAMAVGIALAFEMLDDAERARRPGSGR